MNKVQNIPKDHYVPQMYLDAFAIEGPGSDTPHIFQYMENKIVSPRIKDVASERNFYTVTDKNTNKPIRDIDDLLGKAEDTAAKPLKKIIRSGNIKIDKTEREQLAIFFALLAVRTPGFINSSKSFEEEAVKEFMAVKASNINQLKKSLEKTGIFLTARQLKEQQKFILEKEYNIDFDNKDHFLAKGFEIAYEFAEWYHKRKHWHLLISSSDKVFITSDNPVVIYRPIYVPIVMSAGFGNGTLIIPISPKFALLLRDIPLKNKEIKLSSAWVEKINKDIMQFSTNYIFSNLKSKHIFESYNRNKGKKYQKIAVKRHKFAPYIFMGPPPVPEEFLF